MEEFEFENNKEIAERIVMEARTIYALARLLKSDAGKCIEYDSIMRATERLEDIAMFLRNNSNDKIIKTMAMNELVSKMKDEYFNKVGMQFDNAILEMEKIAEKLSDE